MTMSFEKLCVNWPERRGIYKFIQLYAEHQPYLRFGITHSYVFARIRNEFGLEWKRDGKLFVPEPRIEGYKICGMGCADIRHEENLILINLSMYSTSFYMRPDAEHLEKIKVLEHKWTFDIK